MHEYTIVEQLIERLLAECNAKQAYSVKLVHLRRGSTFSEAPLRQAFEMLSPGTPLNGAKLVIDEFAVNHTCGNCGKRQAVTADDLIGHMFVCPDCGAADEIEEAHGLELLEVEYGV